MSEILSKYHDRHHILGNVGNARPYLFDGFCDIGALRDIIDIDPWQDSFPFSMILIWRKNYKERTRIFFTYAHICI